MGRVWSDHTCWWRVRAVSAVVLVIAVLVAQSASAQVPARDSVSDGVGATFAEFRVDESGQAVYSIPIFAPPGTAGVQPALSLVYNSGGGNGPMGKGWSIGGQSAITRCRKTREHGDFLAGGVPVDGDSAPVRFDRNDVFCLDGQRLLLIAGTNYGDDGSTYAPELDPFTRVTAHGGHNGAAGYSGPTWFSVRRRDGSTSEYGNTADSRIERTPCVSPPATCTAQPAAAWAQNRFEDSTGNYMVYAYSETGFAYTTRGIDYQLRSVTYTGRRQLPGQTTPASAPYAGVYFNYEPIVSPNGWEPENGFLGGSRVTLTQTLASIEVRDQINGTPRVLRHYTPTYAISGSGSRLRVMRSIRECRDATQAVCYPATVFRWSDEDGAAFRFDTQDARNTAGSPVRVGTLRVGDVDGDGRMDVVWFRRDDPACPGGNRLRVGFGDRIESGGTSALTLATPDHATFCTGLNANNNALAAGIGLLDFDGDGRDDLLIADPAGTPGGRWRLYRSLGRPGPGGAVFDTSTDLMNVAIPLAGSQDQAQLGDFNGDGLVDLIYPTGPNGLAVRFLTRKATGVGFEFGPAYAITNFLPSDCTGGISCNLEIFRQTTAGFGVASDFNGDGRADLVLRVTLSSSLQAGVSLPPVTFHETDSLAEQHPDFARGFQSQRFYAFVMAAKNDAAQTQALAQYGGALYVRNDLGPQDPRHFQFADFNGDGLADLFYSIDGTSEDFRFALSTGTAFEGPVGSVASGQIRSIKNREHVRLADIDGDGRAEILYPTDTGTPCPGSAGADRVFRYRRYTVERNGFDDPADTNPHGNAPCVPGGGAKAQDLTDVEYLFADFDGDGAPDYLRLRDRLGSSGGQSQPQLLASRAGTTSRFKRRDAIVRITNGYGAVTDIAYQPQTNKAVYRRLKHSRNQRRDGRDSPVQDLLNTEYVVSRVSSSAPTLTSQNDTATVWYRYAGGRVQAGGRGFLGFQEIVTFDANPVDGRHTASKQLYRQDFPFIGASTQTEKYLLTGAPTLGSAALDACATNPEAPGRDCFYDPGDTADDQHPTFGQLGATLVQASATLWGCQGTGGAEVCTPTPPVTSCPSFPEGLSAAHLPWLVEHVAQASVFGPEAPSGTIAPQPIFPYAPRTLDVDVSPETGTVVRHVCSLFAYGDGLGNATSTTVSTYDGANVATLLASTRTLNAYINDVANWRIGRLYYSEVQDTRDGVTHIRIADFDYEVDYPGHVSPTDTGLLKGEWIQRGIADTQELRTLYTLDDYGQRTHQFTCSALTASGSPLTDAQCRNTALVQQRPVGATGPTTAVHRYQRQTFTANGRYPIATFVPFFGGGSGQVNEQATLTVTARDEFGHVTGQIDANGLTATALYGALGRPYYSADATGQRSTVTYRWCGGGANQVSCPAGARFREQTVTAGGPARFAYHDALGRVRATAVQSFNAGIAGTHWSMQCVAYDRHGRVAAQSVPFFLPAAHGTGAAPTFTANDPVCSASSLAGRLRVHEHDALGRPIGTMEADGALTVMSYHDRSTTVEDPRGRRERQLKNALGEVVAITQADAVTGLLTGNTLAVTHQYDAQGNLRFVRRNAGTGEIVTERQYDALGRLTRLIDPDRGTTDSWYNAAGELIAQQDARGERIEQDIDALGRVWRRRAGPAGSFGGPADRIFANGFQSAAAGGLIVDAWHYDTATHGLGALERVSRDGPDGAWARLHTYDALGRPGSAHTSFDAASYTESTTYDLFGRVATVRDASGDTTTHHYGAHGYLETLSYSRAGVGTGTGVFYEVLEHDARGQVSQERRGGSIITTKAYSQARGWVESIQTPTLQQWSYGYDANGNLSTRTRGLGTGSRTETLTYDRLDRLTGIQLSQLGTPLLTTAMSYDRLGNLCGKGPAGSMQTYTYAGRAGCAGAGGSASARPHAVTAVGTTSYQYDALGQMTLADAPGTADDRRLTYDALAQAVSMSRGPLGAPTAQAQFAYGPDGARYRRIDRSNGALVRTTRYVGNVEVVIEGGITTTKRYLGGGLIVATFSNQPGTVQDRYALTDHLGSIDVIVNDAGAAVANEGMSFDAWGARRDATTWQGSPSILPTTTPRGFTGHEHIDALGLIHVNGRIYDPALARFVQADVLLDAGIQGLNRYSYVLNNPLSATDPTGHLTTRKWGNLFMTAVMAIGTGGLGSAAQAGSATATQVGMATVGMGAMAGAIQSQNLKGAAWGAFSALAFWGIGSYFDGATWAKGGNVMGSGMNLGGYASKVLAHGVTGGVVQHLQGGKFGSGFAAAGVTQAVSGAIDRIDPANPRLGVAARVAAAAIVGGSVSDMTGGKFANGALTGAFSRLFNDELTRAKAESFLQVESQNAGQLYPTSYTSAIDAHEAAANRYLGASIQARREAGWRVYENGSGRYSFTYPSIGPIGSEQLTMPSRLPGQKFDSAGHTHWGTNVNFSGKDWAFITGGRRSGGVGSTLYLAGRDGNLQYSTPSHARGFGVSRGASYMPPSTFPGILVPGLTIKTTYP